MCHMEARPDRKLLEPALRAARKVIADIEVADTPAALRKIKASSARTLPPPLAASLIEQLDKDKWLREEVCKAEEWDAGSSSMPLAVSSLFVKRPKGWSARLEKLMADHLEVVEEVDRVQLNREVAKLSRELESARSRAKVAARGAKIEIKALRDQVQHLRSESGSPKSQEGKSAHALRQQIRTLEQQLAKAEEDRTTALTRNQRMKADLLRSRRAKPESKSIGERVFGGRTPAALARIIDDLAAAARPDAVAEEVVASERQLIALPNGVSPDNPAAIDWLLARTSSTVLVVDGYNVTWQVDGSTFSSNRARQDLVTRLGQLKHRAKGPVRVVAVFDSQFGTIVPVLGSAVEVVFAEDADEEVRRLAKKASGDVVVISSDREVQDGSQAGGTLVLWSEAFTRWR